MVTVKENTTLVGISEFRTKADAIFQQLKNSKVIIERRNRPIAVMVSIKKYEELEEMLEWIEDNALGYLAKKREKSTPGAKYISSQEAAKKIGL